MRLRVSLSVLVIVNLTSSIALIPAPILAQDGPAAPLVGYKDGDGLWQDPNHVPRPRAARIQRPGCREPG